MSEAIVPRCLSYKDAAKYLGISTSNFRAHILPKLKPVAITPGRRIVTRDQLDQLLDGPEKTKTNNPFDRHCL